MRTWTMKLGLSLMVVLSFRAERLPAQEITIGPFEHILVVPAAPYEPARVMPMPYVAAPRTPPPPARHAVNYLFNMHGMGCQSNAPWGACGSYHYDMRFIFGSCRDFFGEPCYPCVFDHKFLPR